MVSGSDQVPFYFQQTLGGSDINGNRALASYDDYRFRGPHLLLVQESLEHSLYGPIGILVEADQGKVALQQESLGFSDLHYSYIVGLTVRAGGFRQLRCLTPPAVAKAITSLSPSTRRSSAVPRVPVFTESAVAPL